MKKVFISLLFFLLSSLWILPSNGTIVELTSANWNKELNEGKTFVKFYAPWCGFCKKLIPTWESLDTELDKKVKVAKIDCTVPDNERICAAYDIKGFPTLKLIENGKVASFDDSRDLNVLKRFALNTKPTEEAPNPAHYVRSNENVGKKAEQPPPEPPKNKWSKNSGIIPLYDHNIQELKDGIWLVEFYADWCGNCNHFIPEYEKLAAQLKDKIKVAKADIESISSIYLRAFGVTKVPTLKFLRNGAVYNISYYSQPSEQIVKFIDSEYVDSESSPFPHLPALHLPNSNTHSAPVNFSFDDLLLFISQNETLLGSAAAFGLFLLGFIFGRITAPSVSSAQKQKKK